MSVSGSGEDVTPHDRAQRAILEAWWGSPVAAHLTHEEAQAAANAAITAMLDVLQPFYAEVPQGMASLSALVSRLRVAADLVDALSHEATDEQECIRLRGKRTGLVTALSCAEEALREAHQYGGSDG